MSGCEKCRGCACEKARAEAGVKLLADHPGIAAWMPGPALLAPARDHLDMVKGALGPEAQAVLDAVTEGGE